VSSLHYKVTYDHRSAPGDPAFLPARLKSSGLFDNLILGLSQTKSARPFPGGAVFSFTSCSSGDGVTYIVERVARDVGICTGERVLIVTAARLKSLLPAELKHLEGCTSEIGPGVLILSEERNTQMGPFAPIAYDVLLEALRKEFGYILIDCAAMTAAPQAVALATHADGTLLVIAAGETRVSQVEQAQRLIENASGRLLGCVLNKRTYPIPRFLYERL
jgi:hypothetical protein